MSLKQIIEGTANNVLNREEELSKKRMAICSKCELLTDSVLGKMCNSKMYINPITKEVSFKKLNGFIKGCGCILESKTRVKEAACPGGKW